MAIVIICILLFCLLIPLQYTLRKKSTRITQGCNRKMENACYCLCISSHREIISNCVSVHRVDLSWLHDRCTSMEVYIHNTIVAHTALEESIHPETGRVLKTREGQNKKQLPNLWQYPKKVTSPQPAPIILSRSILSNDLMVYHEHMVLMMNGCQAMYTTYTQDLHMGALREVARDNIQQTTILERRIHYLGWGMSKFWS